MVRRRIILVAFTPTRRKSFARLIHRARAATSATRGSLHISFWCRSRRGPAGVAPHFSYFRALTCLLVDDPEAGGKSIGGGAGHDERLEGWLASGGNLWHDGLRRQAAEACRPDGRSRAVQQPRRASPESTIVRTLAGDEHKRDETCRRSGRSQARNAPVRNLNRKLIAALDMDSTGQSGRWRGSQGGGAVAIPGGNNQALTWTLSCRNSGAKSAPFGHTSVWNSG